AAAPDMDPADLAEHTGSEDFHDLPVILASVDLRAHLGLDVLAGGRFHHYPDFMDRVSQWLLAVDVLAGAHGCHANDCLGVVRSADDDGINITPVQQPAVVLDKGGLGETPAGGRPPGPRPHPPGGHPFP